MKKLLGLALIGLMGLSVGCRNSTQKDVVKETYIHKYGVPVAKEDWSRNGKDGQVAQLFSDGITVTRTFEKGVLQGPVTYTFPNSSTIHIVENYNQGELVSKTENYPSGVPMEESKYENMQLATVTRWYEDGTPAALEAYEYGALLTGEYRTPLNQVESRVLEGVGTRLIHGTEGGLALKDKIQNGQLVERIAYFANGDPSSITPYDNGHVHGVRLTFLPGGLPNTVEQWISGEQDGITTLYQNGEKVSEIPYVKNQKQGVEYRYRDGKTLVEEVSWKNGIQHGPRKILADEATKTEWYHQGELVTRTTYERLNPPR